MLIPMNWIFPDLNFEQLQNGMQSGPNEKKNPKHGMSNVHNGNETENCLLEKRIRHLESIVLQAQF